MSLKHPLGQTLGTTRNKKRQLRTTSCKNLLMINPLELPSPLITMTPHNRLPNTPTTNPNIPEPERQLEVSSKKEIIKSRIKTRLNKLLCRAEGDTSTPAPTAMHTVKSWKKHALLSTQDVISKSYIDSLQKSYVDYLNKKHRSSLIHSPRASYEKQVTRRAEVSPIKQMNFSQCKTQQSQSMNNMEAHHKNTKRTVESLQTEIRISSKIRNIRPPSAFFANGKSGNKRPATAGTGIVFCLRSYLLKKLEGEGPNIKKMMSPSKDNLRYSMKNMKKTRKSQRQKKEMPLTTVKKYMENYQSGDIKPWDLNDQVTEL